MANDINTEIVSELAKLSKKKDLLAPIYFEDGSAFSDGQSFEFGIEFLLLQLSRFGMVGLNPDQLTSILNDTERKTAGQLISMLRKHVEVSTNIEEGLTEVLKARNKLGFRGVTMRGENYARGQFLFACAVHNVTKAVRFKAISRKSGTTEAIVGVA